eukprot:188181_1
MTSTVVNQSCRTYLYITSILIMVSPSFGGLLYGIEKEKGILFTVDVTAEPVEYKELGEFSGFDTKMLDIDYDCINKKMYVSAQKQKNEETSIVSEINMNDATEISSVSVSGVYKALEYVNHSTLYGWNMDDAWHHGLRILNPVTGNAYFISTGISDDVDPLGGIAYSIETNTMYGVTSPNDKKSLLLTIDLDSGEPATVILTEIEQISSLAFADNGVLYGGTSGDGIDMGIIYEIDTDTGATTPVIDISGDEKGDAVFKITGLTWVSDEGCPTIQPTASPSVAPTEPTLIPTKSPTNNPTITTLTPTNNPTTLTPTKNPTTLTPTKNPTTLTPTNNPTKSPTNHESKSQANDESKSASN